MKTRHAELMKAVISQAIVDYAFVDKEGDRPHRKEVREWVESMRGTFDLCAMAWDKPPEVLQAIMLDKMRRIDEGETVKPKKE